MGKQGPCCHCGVPSTPLWRNGPPDKPILCNACGSRWRTKGSLTNYIPLHARAESDNFLNNKASRIKIVASRNIEKSFLKRKQPYENVVIRNFAPNYSDDLWKAIDDDTSNRSSYGSAVSNSESYDQFEAAYVNELTGYSHSFAIDAERTNPTKKRASNPLPKSSSVATLTKDLCTILQQQQSSGFYRPEEGDLLFESEKSMLSAETGHGSYLIRDTRSISQDEDSEASSFSVGNKLYIASETCSYSKRPAVDTPDMRVGGISTDLGIVQLEKSERNNKLSEIFDSYGSQSWPLPGIIDQKEALISDHEELPTHLRNEDDSTQPNGIESLSGSTDFVDSFSTFSEGGINASLSEEVKSDDYNHLKRLVMQHYNVAKKFTQETEGSTEILKKIHIRDGKGKTKADKINSNSTVTSPRNLITLGG